MFAPVHLPSPRTFGALLLVALTVATLALPPVLFASPAAQAVPAERFPVVPLLAGLIIGVTAGILMRRQRWA